MRNEEHALNLLIIVGSIGSGINTEFAASLRAGAAALRKLDHLRRFAEELGKHDETPVLMGFAHYLHVILDTPNDAAALKRLEEE